ncbi:putative cfxQ-like protein [Tupanvirus soda lake]|uniref:CfxQ-like protein n=2 Tax=Tupanvirus TaxID=2094720 RepID=A0AC62ACZ7_9VIRU|nr:putative cfxQ-like protein [Tupanvirus soda lake]QKU35624.1 putative cfxQ-like protein [Tupanvirus soda lake]
MYDRFEINMKNNNNGSIIKSTKSNKRSYQDYLISSYNHNNNKNNNNKTNTNKRPRNNNNNSDNNNKRPRNNNNSDNNNKRPRNNNNNDNNNKRPRSDDNKNTNTNKRPRKNNEIVNKNINQSLPPILFFLNGLDDLNDIDDGSTAQPPEPVYVCPGKFCDHDPESKNIPLIPERFTNVKSDYKITLKDLIDLGASFHCKLQQMFHNISLERLAKLYEPLVKLHTMIGMKVIKENFAEQIVYFLLDLEPNPAEMLHTILEGPPGVGKSHVVDLLAEIYLNMGYLTKKVVKKVKINDLKGKYIGHTAPLTQKAIDEAMGGVLVIDEAYSLGSAERLDSFSKELIDTLNRNLTENAGKFVCIIAGYGDQIEKCLFAHNVGLRSRFRFRFVIDTYKADELMEIFVLKVEKDKWSIHPHVKSDDIINFFKENFESFKYFGRDMETLLFHTKVSHSNRVFFEPKENKGKITIQDLKSGYQRFILHSNIKKEDEMPMSVKHMYL